MKQHFLFLLLFGAISLGAQAQARKRTVNLAFGVQVSQPGGQFANLYDGHPAGLATNISIPLSQTPFEIGAGFAWNSMGSQEEEIGVLAGIDEDGDDMYEIGNMRIRSNNYRYQLLTRFRPFTGKFQLYADAFAGMESFITRTDIAVDNSGYTEVINSEVRHRDYTIDYGWALGTRIRLANGFYVDGRFEKIEGGPARYVDPASIQVDHESNHLMYDVRESQTDRFTYQLGIAFQF